eukprot:1160047-Pelagomonas_calceolata.AAC.1
MAYEGLDNDVLALLTHQSKRLPWQLLSSDGVILCLYFLSWVKEGLGQKCCTPSGLHHVSSPVPFLQNLH